jgi:hypothetical protein
VGYFGENAAEYGAPPDHTAEDIDEATAEAASAASAAPTLAPAQRMKAKFIETYGQKAYDEAMAKKAAERAKKGLKGEGAPDLRLGQSYKDPETGEYTIQMGDHTVLVPRSQQQKAQQGLTRATLPNTMIGYKELAPQYGIRINGGSKLSNVRRNFIRKLGL